MTIENASKGFPLATSTWDAEEYAALQEVIASDRFTMGERVRTFESEFADFVGAGFAVMVNSGSSANLLAVAAAVLDDAVDLNPGDEVLVPAVSWATTYYPLQQYGLRLKFVDVDLDTLNLDLEAAVASITPRTKAILWVSLLGNPADYAALDEFARQHGLVVIEDNCESLGARSGGIAAGTFGLMGTYSTFFSHHISTMEGGLVVTDELRLSEALKSLRAHGWTRDLPAQNSIAPKSGDPFDDLFRFVMPGYNLRPLEMSGALGSAQLRKLPGIVEGRRHNASLFLEAMSGRDDVRLQREVGESSWFGFSLILEGRLQGRRRELVGALSQAGIEARPIVAGNFTRNPVIAKMDADVPTSLPAADRIHDDGLFVGNHHYPIPSEIELLRSVLDDFA